MPGRYSVGVGILAGIPMGHTHSESLYKLDLDWRLPLLEQEETEAQFSLFPPVQRFFLTPKTNERQNQLRRFV